MLGGPDLHNGNSKTLTPHYNSQGFFIVKRIKTLMISTRIVEMIFLMIRIYLRIRINNVVNHKKIPRKPLNL